MVLIFFLKKSHSVDLLVSKSFQCVNDFPCIVSTVVQQIKEMVFIDFWEDKLEIPQFESR